MIKDPIIDEIHSIRERQAAKFNNNLDLIFQDIISKQKENEKFRKYFNFEKKEVISELITNK